MKKLLFIIFLMFCIVSFAQDVDSRSVNSTKNNFSTTLTSVSASPNPFNVKTRIKFHSNKMQTIIFSVKNLVGNTVYQEKVNGRNGLNIIEFERYNIPKGMYIYSLQTEVEIISKRLVIR